MSKVMKSVVFEVEGVERVVAVKVSTFDEGTLEEAQKVALSEMMQRGYSGVIRDKDYGDTLYFGYGSLAGEPAESNWWLKFSEKPNCYVFEGVR